MNRRRFRLHRVLAYKRQLERSAQLSLAALEAAFAAEQRALARLQQEEQAQWDLLGQLQRSSSLDVNSIVQTLYYIPFIGDIIARHQERLAEIMKHIAERREVLVARSQERRILERLEQKQAEAQQQAQARAESKAVDDITSTTYARGRAIDEGGVL